MKHGGGTALNSIDENQTDLRKTNSEYNNFINKRSSDREQMYGLAAETGSTKNQEINIDKLTIPI